MTFEFGWHKDDKSIVYVKLPERAWTWEEYAPVLKEAFALVRSVDHVVDGMVINNHMQFDAHLNRFRQVYHQLPPNLDCIVVVTTNPLVASVNRLFFLFANRYRERFFLASSVKEAEAIIARYRAGREQGRRP